jgi:glycine/D-amino acid oxidase-like deaminating enzyme
MAHAEAEAKSLEKFGYKWERIEGDELRRRDPCFRHEVAGAIHMKDSAHCAPNDLIAGLVRALPRHGVETRFDAEVRAFRQSRSGAVTAVELTSGETIAADAIVLAAGVWSDALGRLAGVKIPMQGARGYHLQFDYPAENPPPLPSTGMVLHETFVAITPMAREGKQQRLRSVRSVSRGCVNALRCSSRVRSRTSKDWIDSSLQQSGRATVHAPPMACPRLAASARRLGSSWQLVTR